MNNLKSYTEYAVTTPTTDFVIGFDFNYGTDAVNVTVDDVPASVAGYSVIYLNSTTMRLSPAVPSGVVRLQRETDIDVPDNQFTAGAKFIASNMDENFTQIRHAQQEVRDGFGKLSEDTYEIIDTLQVVGQAAQDAADAAEQAAQTANDAAVQVNDKVSYQDLDTAVATSVQNTVAEGLPATGIKDSSGATQQEINDNTPRFFKSLNDLLSTKPKNSGQLVTLFAYHDGSQRGGSDLIAIQSSILIENGVTVFRSNVVGYEDYFWVRVNTSHITPEMAGAIGDKVFNCYDAFKRCLAIGGDFLLREGGEYLLEGYDSEVGVVMNFTKPTHFISGKRRASIYFKHTAPTASPNAARIGTDDEPMVGFTLENINVYGHPNRGHENYAERCWGLSFAGVHQGKMKNVKFSTFQGRPFTIGRRQVDWIQSSDLNNANTKAAIDRLLALSSTDFEITNIHQEYCRSAGGAIFGGNRVYIDGVTADLTESLAKLVIWTDDASSQTPLSAYGINHEIHIKNVICPDGIIALDGTSKGSIKDCTVDKIGYRSYDFDQQKNNFNSIAHTYNTNDFLNMPFLWMDHLDRSIVVTENKVNDIDVRGAYTSVYENIVSSKANNSTLYLESTNAIQWGTGVSYYDHYYTGTTELKPKLIRNNEFVINHTGITCVGYDSVNTSQFFPVLDSVIHNPKGYAFTHMQYANSRNRKDSYTTIDVSNASKNVNHPINVRQSMLTQGIGYNHMKTLVNVRSGQGSQALARFRNTASPVVFRIFIVAANGNCLDKKVSIDAAGAATVTNLDALTTWNTGVFGVTINSDGSKTLTANVGSDASFDIQANGVWGDCIFELPDTRGGTTG